MNIENVLLVECDLGGPSAGAANGGRALFSALNTKPDIIDVIRAPLCPVRESLTPNAHYLSEINSCIQSISNVVEAYYKDQPEKRLTVIAGDHSTACGSVAGLKKAFPDKRIGVVWIDAHADIHSPYTTPSGNVHGMPVAAAVGIDHRQHAINQLDVTTDALWQDTKQICGSAFELSDLVYIGIRDLEQEEWDIINEYQIPYFSVSDVKTRGGFQVANEALEKLSCCELIYVSFDIDSLDASLFPGTGTPVFDGLDAISAVEILSTLVHSGKVNMLEVVEINPLLDCKNETAQTIAKILEGAS